LHSTNGFLLGLPTGRDSSSATSRSRLAKEVVSLDRPDAVIDGLGKSAIDTALVVLMVLYAPALLMMYVVIWLTSPFKNKIIQVSAAFASILAITHLAGAFFEAVAVLGVFAVDLLTGQVVARMEKRERNKLAKAA
jgi:hypothetical protein